MSQDINNEDDDKKNENEKELEQEQEKDNSQDKINENASQKPPKKPPQRKKARLVLTKIELENFKSYHGRRVIGPFHKRFSSIVGPNGSGKSNVIDALLFVFGRRAKQIRLKKISELVHTSEEHPNCTQARVNVHFQEIIDTDKECEGEDESKEDENNLDNQYDVVPNSQFIISRIATKRSQSQYLINNKSTTFHKVKELLLTKDVDLNNNRFLILQGEVESIAMMKPKGMTVSDDGLLEYLEDIIGSNKYVQEIEKASEQVETLTNEVQERLNRVKVVERDRDKLEEAKIESENYIKSQLQLWKLQGVNKQIQINKYQNKIDSMQDNLKLINEQLKEKENKQQEMKNEMNEIEDKYQTLKKEKNVCYTLPVAIFYFFCLALGILCKIKKKNKTKKKIEKEWKKANKKFQEYEEQDVAHNERLKYLKKEISKIKKNRNKLERQKENFEETIKSNQSSIPRLDEEIENLQEKLQRESSKQEDMMTSLAMKTEPIKERMEEQQKDLMPLKDKENEIKQEINVIVANIESIKNKINSAQDRKQNILNRINDINQNLNEKKQQFEVNKNEIQKYQQDQKNLSKNLQKLQNEEKKTEPLIEDIRKEYDEARYSFENGKRSNQIVSALKAAQEKGDLTGILGRLGDLGAIDQKYDVAASTAATAALNYIVVERTHHAQRAVEYLKRNNIGRATMLILEKQRHLNRKCHSKISTPQNVDRLFDLITPKEDRYQVAFYFAFRDTLVARDLHQANGLKYIVYIPLI